MLEDPLLSIRARPLEKFFASRILGPASRRLPALALPFARRVHRSVVRQLERILADLGIDVLHLNNQPGRDLYGFLVAERTGVPVVSHMRSMRSGTFHRRTAAYANRIATAFVANSRATLEHWTGLGIDREKIRIVYNGVACEDVRAVDLDAVFGLTLGAREWIGSVANLNEAKGHDPLLRAFRRLREHRPGCRLVLVGDGHLRERLEGLARELGLGDDVVFAGYRDRPLDILASCRVAVVSSATEGFGRAAVEAMALGVPLVATGVGGLAEVVEDGVSGLVVPYGDPDPLAVAMERVLTDEPFRDRLAKGGLATARTRFGVDRYAREMADILGAAASRPRLY